MSLALSINVPSKSNIILALRASDFPKSHSKLFNNFKYYLVSLRIFYWRVKSNLTQKSHIFVYNLYFIKMLFEDRKPHNLVMRIVKYWERKDDY